LDRPTTTIIVTPVPISGPQGRAEAAHEGQGQTEHQGREAEEAGTGKPEMRGTDAAGQPGQDGRHPERDDPIFLAIHPTAGRIYLSVADCLERQVKAPVDCDLAARHGNPERGQGGQGAAGSIR